MSDTWLNHPSYKMTVKFLADHNVSDELRIKMGRLVVSLPIDSYDKGVAAVLNWVYSSALVMP